MDWVQVNWHGPYPIETAQNREESDEIGVYSIWETSTKTPKLIYIGETYSQTFSKRLQQHKKEWLYRTDCKKHIHFGFVVLTEGRRLTQNIVFDIEATLINAYIPPFNTMSKKGYTGRNLLLVNTGKRGGLSPLVGDPELVKLLRPLINK